MCSTEVYDAMQIAVRQNVSYKTIGPFKQDARYLGICDHTSSDNGEWYAMLSLMKYNIPKDLIVDFCNLNDTYGSPIKRDIKAIGQSVCPSSLHAFYTALRILNHYKDQTVTVSSGDAENESKSKEYQNIVEIGGNCGSLCLAIHFLCKRLYTDIVIPSYTLIDLPAMKYLQQRYLSQFPEIVDMANIKFMNAYTFGEDVRTEQNFVIAVYSFAEFDSATQSGYVSKLMSKVTHGYVRWNHSVVDIGIPEKKRKLEIPETSNRPHNPNLEVFY